MSPDPSPNHWVDYLHDELRDLRRAMDDRFDRMDSRLGDLDRRLRQLESWQSRWWRTDH